MSGVWLSGAGGWKDSQGARATAGKTAAGRATGSARLQQLAEWVQPCTGLLLWPVVASGEPTGMGISSSWWVWSLCSRASAVPCAVDPQQFCQAAATPCTGRLMASNRVISKRYTGRMRRM